MEIRIYSQVSSYERVLCTNILMPRTQKHHDPCEGPFLKYRQLDMFIKTRLYYERKTKIK